MTQVLEAPTTAPSVSAPQLIVMENGKPRYALIDYELYLALQEAIDDWYADQRAIATYERYLRGEEPTRPWSEIKAELIAKGLIDADESTVGD